MSRPPRPPTTAKLSNAPTLPKKTPGVGTSVARPGTGLATTNVAPRAGIREPSHPSSCTGRQQRQVLDNMFYVGLLREKTKEINAECDMLLKATEDYDIDESEYVSLQKRCVQSRVVITFMIQA